MAVSAVATTSWLRMNDVTSHLEPLSQPCAAVATVSRLPVELYFTLPLLPADLIDLKTKLLPCSRITARHLLFTDLLVAGSHARASD